MEIQPELFRPAASEDTDINARNEDGNTPLHGTIMMAQQELVEFLISRGADVNAENKDGDTPLLVAAFMIAAGPEAIVELNRALVSQGADARPAETFDKIAAILLSNGARINIKNNSGFTPLHIVSASGKAELVQLLISGGADVNAENRDGFTALHGAAGKGYVDVAGLLISSGADVNARGHNGATALHEAAGRGHFEMAEFLISNGADVNAKDIGGDTPLIYVYAAATERQDIVNLLRNHGATE
ncbi:MAG: ankyrin repeat domain-containing protein [Vulcanimicrobiota bacterium]